MPNNNQSQKDQFLLSYKPIQRFVDGVGAGILKYIGKDKACVIGLGDDGVFYGEGMYAWLKKKGAAVVFATMDYDCSGLDESKVSGRKILVVDNDIITGTAYRDVMGIMGERQKALGFRDIKYAVLCDRTKLADFAVEGYTTTAGSEIVRLDSTDFKILHILAKDGRVSFAEIAAENGLTVSGAKKRMEKLIRDKVVEVRGRINIDKFYSVSALVSLEVSPNKAAGLITKLRKSQMVYLLLKVYDRSNLLVGLVGSNLAQINEFVEKNIGDDPAVRGVSVRIAEVPLLPQSK